MTEEGRSPKKTGTTEFRPEGCNLTKSPPPASSVYLQSRIFPPLQTKFLLEFLPLQKKSLLSTQHLLRNSTSILQSVNMSFQAGGRGCFNCGEATHQARDCPKKGTPTCYNCGGMQYLPRYPVNYSITMECFLDFVLI
ncbi:hypothetical protein BJY04DRAFT_60671 [Aspergillus karnatakaensis]|uniref:putative zinc knuckle domain protein (Byr3) n=1 Tax=Aspergillus karnatakaensis TaxID=1810916 RepID=UPI003CCD02A7